jgi:hypothetical protein
MNRDLYQFPTTRFVSNSLCRQWWHLLPEVFEIGWELLWCNLQRAATETWNAKHSAETLHHILEGRGADIAMGYEQTLYDNVERGYYVEDPEP